MPLSGVKALTFDVFGTVVDWRSSIIHEATAMELRVDAAEFADAWRAGYQPAMARVRSGELGWTNIDTLHRMILDELLRKYRIDELSEARKTHLNRVWHRLAPWPDSARGLAMLRKEFICATLSNGNISLLVDLARHGGLTWDCVLSAELYRAYKPDAAVYLGAAATLGIKPEEAMMVAAHKNDLLAARKVGLKTAFVERPLERGSGGPADKGREDWMDIYAKDFVDLANQLGAGA
ncbi:MAG: haloacid dehalogenase type II [Acidobacteria bacterium]|nr:haloacid dehalogenase type II [Acidobacteriota bacterium]